MDGFNIDAIPSSRKIYYTASEKITPKENSLGSKVMVNMYDATTMNGVIVTESDIITIEKGVFNFYRNLTSVIIPDSVTSIGESAFDDCSSLTSITIPDSVTSIGHYAFRSCNSLESIYIPSNVNSVGIYTFNNCANLKEFKRTTETEPKYLLIVNNTVVAYAPKGIKENGILTIPDNVTSIGNQAFNHCTNLTSVNIPDNVTEIGFNAFDHCQKLTSVTIGNGVTSIGSNAFQFCQKLTSVTIGNGVTTIGKSAFYNCSSLTSVYCKATTPPTLDSSTVFESNGSGRKIYVPAGSVDAYKNATNWSEYADAIIGYDFENNTVIE